MQICDIPVWPGRYVTPSGRVTDDSTEADQYEPADSDAPTRPVPGPPDDPPGGVYALAIPR